MAATTSADATGLLELLESSFERRSGVQIRAVVTGSGKALRLARDGEVDMVLVHNPEGERRLVEEGWGVERRRVAYNDFILLGPKDDGIAAPPDDVLAWLRAIAAAGAPFVSRGDDSGTHRMELTLWRHADVEPADADYLSVGRGQAGALSMAGQKDAYVLSDKGSWLAQRTHLGLVVRCEGDPLLHNPYHLIAVNPERHPHVRYRAAQRFIDFVTGPEGRALIERFRIDGEPPFHLFPPEGS